VNAPRRSQSDAGWVTRRFKALERQLREQAAAAAKRFSGAIAVDDDGVHLIHAAGTTVSVGTTSSGANGYIDPVDGRLLRVVSSRRYKQDIEAADVDVDQALQLQPRRFRIRTDVEQHGEQAGWYVGFIAEEAADLELDAWVTSDAEGPEAFDYPQWVVALQAIALHQHDRIRALESRVADLAATVAALTTEGR
jgi:hypothetical protein